MKPILRDICRKDWFVSRSGFTPKKGLACPSEFLSKTKEELLIE